MILYTQAMVTERICGYLCICTRDSNPGIPSHRDPSRLIQYPMIITIEILGFQNETLIAK